LYTFGEKNKGVGHSQVGQNEVYRLQSVPGEKYGTVNGEQESISQNTSSHLEEEHNLRDHINNSHLHQVHGGLKSRLSPRKEEQ
jgi:hypothetical protein